MMNPTAKETEIREKDKKAKTNNSLAHVGNKMIISFFIIIISVMYHVESFNMVEEGPFPEWPMADKSMI
jgi:hypothetical protein